jgi:D-alanine--poly(phosphoribitol) ligase subunit 2
MSAMPPASAAENQVAPYKGKDMQDSIRTFVLALLEKKSRLPKGFDDASDFIKSGIVDSVGIIKFILEIESRFDIEITEADIESDEFRTVQGLVAMIGRKTTVNAKEK